MTQVKDETMVEIQNLADHSVVYISYDGKRRSLSRGQKIKVPAVELRQLNYSIGGEYLIHNYLSIKNKSLALELNVSEDSFDNEYSWTVKEVDAALADSNNDVLEDALNFAPQGVIELIQQRAIETKINDLSKRELIKNITGVDIDKKIKVQEEVRAALENGDDAIRQMGTTTKQRKAGTKTTTTTRQRKAKPKVEESAAEVVETEE